MARDLTMKCCLVGCLLVGLARAATGQGGVSGGEREILSIGFANGALPREIKPGVIAVTVSDQATVASTVNFGGSYTIYLRVERVP
jgi:hypothetical protein